MSGLLAQRAHTLYAPGTPEGCRELIEVGTADDASRRLNLHAFRVEWSSSQHATIRTAGLPRRTTHVHLSRHDWGTTAEATTRLDPFQVAVAWLLFVGCAGVAIAMAANRSGGKSVADALVPFGVVALVALTALIWMYARTGSRDAAIVHDVALAIGANSVDGVVSPQYALRPNWPPPSETSLPAGSLRTGASGAHT